MSSAKTQALLKLSPADHAPELEPARGQLYCSMIGTCYRRGHPCQEFQELLTRHMQSA